MSKLGIKVLTKAKETQEKPAHVCKKLSVWNTILYAEAIELAEAFSAAFLSLCVRRGDITEIFYTSGITGEPKGIIPYTMENDLLRPTLKVLRHAFGEKY